VAGEEQRRDLIAQRLVVELGAFRAARRHEALQHPAVLEVGRAMLRDEAAHDLVERSDRGVEARDLHLGEGDERAHEVARRLRPVSLDRRGDVAELVGDFIEGFAEQIAARQTLREPAEFRFDVEDFSARGAIAPAIEETVGVLGHPSHLGIDLLGLERRLRDHALPAPFRGFGEEQTLTEQRLDVPVTHVLHVLLAVRDQHLLEDLGIGDDVEIFSANRHARDAAVLACDRRDRLHRTREEREQATDDGKTLGSWRMPDSGDFRASSCRNERN
jgi:hypothetical protein